MYMALANPISAAEKKSYLTEITPVALNKAGMTLRVGRRDMLHCCHGIKSKAETHPV
jgi:hypothetical protein